MNRWHSHYLPIDWFDMYIIKPIYRQTSRLPRWYFTQMLMRDLASNPSTSHMIVYDVDATFVELITDYILDFIHKYIRKSPTR